MGYPFTANPLTPAGQTVSLGRVFRVLPPWAPLDVTKTRNRLENGPENGLGFLVLDTASIRSYSKTTV